MYRRKDLTYSARNIHVKYQSYSTNCLNVRNKVKVSDRFKKWQTAVNIDSCSILKTTPSLLYKSVSESKLKTSHFCPQISKRSRKELPIKRWWKKNPLSESMQKFDLHITNHFYPSNIASKPWQMNVQIIESSIKDLNWSILFQN